MLGLGLGQALDRVMPGAMEKIHKAVHGATEPVVAPSTEEYWSEHNVTLHHRFKDAAESLEYFRWRNDQYFGYIELMTVSDAAGLTVVDFGCGPGNDLVGFGVYSKPARLIGIDVSGPSIAEARDRVALHAIDCELVHLGSTEQSLPLADGTVDLVHSSGVLHHTPDPTAVLREFHRVLKPGGKARIMVYHQRSLWMHLYVAYQKMLVEGQFAGMSLAEAFQKTTDGPHCPISLAYTAEGFLALAREAGFTGRLLGSSISSIEMTLMAKRYDAIQDARLPPESRRFLYSLKFDDRGLPMFDGVTAGIGACFELQRA